MPVRFPSSRAPRRAVRLNSRLRCHGPWCGLLLAAAAGCKPAVPPAEEKAPPANVKWEGPVQGALEEWTELVGTTTPAPDRAARVTAPVEGRVQSVLVDATGKPVTEGQQVAAGTVLVQLDPTVVQAALAKAEAAQEVLKEEQRQAQFAVELAQAEVGRLQQLQAADDKNMAGGRSLVSPADRLKADVALKDAQSKQAAAAGRLAAGLKEQESLRAQLKLHTLTAPIAGRVGRLLVVRGQTLSIGTPVHRDRILAEMTERTPGPPGQTRMLPRRGHARWPQGRLRRSVTPQNVKPPEGSKREIRK